MNTREFLITLLILAVLSSGVTACGSAPSEEASAAATVAAAEATTAAAEATKAAAAEAIAQVTQVARVRPTDTAGPVPSVATTPAPSSVSATVVPAEEPTDTPLRTPDYTPTTASTETPPHPQTPPQVGDGFAAGSRNADWTPVIQEMNGVPMAYVPAGCFMMGSDEGPENERPAHEVCLSAYWIGETEVINSQYKMCVDARICDPPAEKREYFDDPEYSDHPVVYVDWHNANAYAEWAMNGSLPTEAQWEYAARGPEGWIYPWGDGMPTCQRANTRECGLNGTAPVGPDQRSMGASWVGALDMAGNVWEWVADWYRKEYYASLENGVLDPTGPVRPDGIPSQGSWQVIRGGGWNSERDSMQAASRTTPWWHNDWRRGFRVMVPIPSLTPAAILTATLTQTPEPVIAPSPTKPSPGGSSSNDPFSAIREIEATVAAIEGSWDLPEMPSWFPTPSFGW